MCVCVCTNMLKEAGSDLTQVWFFSIELFLQISDKPELEPVNVLDVPEYHLQLVVVKHVSPLFALLQITLNTHTHTVLF